MPEAQRGSKRKGERPATPPRDSGGDGRERPERERERHQPRTTERRVAKPGDGGKRGRPTGHRPRVGGWVRTLK